MYGGVLADTFAATRERALAEPGLILAPLALAPAVDNPAVEFLEHGHPSSLACREVSEEVPSAPETTPIT